MNVDGSDIAAKTLFSVTLFGIAAVLRVVRQALKQPDLNPTLSELAVGFRGSGILEQRLADRVFLKATGEQEQ